MSETAIMQQQEKRKPPPTASVKSEAGSAPTSPVSPQGGPAAMMVDSGHCDPAAAGVAATTSIKDRLAACEGLVSSLGQSVDPDALTLKAAKEEEIARLRSQLQADRPVRAKLQVATEGRDRIVKILQGHRHDLEVLEKFVSMKRDLARQSEEELAVRATEVLSLQAEFQAELLLQLVPAPLTPPASFALQVPQQQQFSAAHWAAGLSASLASNFPELADSFKSWMQSQPLEQRHHAPLSEAPAEEEEEDEEEEEEDEETALASIDPYSTHGGQSVAGVAMVDPLGGPAGGFAAFGADGALSSFRVADKRARRRTEPYTTPAPAVAAGAVQSPSSESDAELLAACHRVEKSAAEAAAAEVMARMARGEAAAASA